MENLLNRYEKSGYHLVIEEDRLIAFCQKNPGSFKYYFNYRFRSLERLIEFCSEWIERVEINLESKRKIAEKKKEIMAEVKKGNHPYKVGQIIYASWGYEQTNIDFYQVIEVKNSQVKIRAIHGYYKDYYSHGMAANKFPVIDGFKGEEIVKRVQAQVWNNGSNYYLKDNNDHHLHKYENNEGVYCSWYA